jgi:ATP-dependent helicase/nuclease subunit A
MASADAPLHDEDARRRIRTSLDESLLVEAAAGTGKTTVLIERLVAILASGRARVDQIVAVTFTRKAAGELELRLRAQLDRARALAAGEERRRLSEAIARLEEASIGTLHSFCAELLRARPVEAGIDPAFVELDEEQERSLFERVFRSFLERQLEAMPPGLRRILARLAESEQRESPLERLLSAARELAAWRDFPAAWRRDPFEREAEIDSLLDLLEVTLLAARRGRDGDALRRSLLPAESFAAELARREAGAGRRDYDEVEAQLVGLDRELSGKENWRGKGDDYAPGVSRQAMLESRGELLARLAFFRRSADADLASLLREELREAVELYGAAKRSAGRLDFLDLLLFCRDLLRDHPEVRRTLRGKYSHFFVDEAQDTDPLQMEILLLLTADDPEENDWRRARPLPGRLFLVGDPKQSIYRFRRADVLLYLAVKEQLELAGVGVEELSHSFRAGANLQAAINGAFAARLRHDRDAGQPSYVALAGGRDEAPGQPSLVVLPVPQPFGAFGRITQRAIEASFPDAAAAFLRWLIAESGFMVSTADGGRRPVEARDVCLLFRRYQAFGRDVTADYLRALEARQVPHLLIGGRALTEREEASTLRVALTAIEWPEDQLAVYGTLRGDLFALPDGALFRYLREQGRLRPAAEPPGLEAADEEERAIAQALRLLYELHQGRNRLPIADTLNRLLQAVRAHAGFALRPAGNQVLANVLRVADLARRYEMAAGLSFRGFVERLEDASSERGESGAPGLEEGADGVRLMTVHAAKGLEFPVVLLADPSCRSTGRGAPRFLDPARGLCATRLVGLAPAELEEAAELEMAREAAEAVRLAYVAATRARDLLVVPGLGSGRLEDGWLLCLDEAILPAAGARPRQPAELTPGLPPFGRHTVLGGGEQVGLPEIAPGLYASRGGGEVLWWDPGLLELERPRSGGVDGADLLAPDDDGGRGRQGLERYLSWQAEKEAALLAGGTPGREVVAVTETAQAPEGAAVRLELLAATPVGPARPRGRRFGALVHQVLRDLPLDRPFDPAAAESLARLHGRGLGAPQDEVAAAPALARALLGHPLFARVRAAAKVRREVPFTLRLPGDFLVEGVIDLLFEDREGLTVIDFKTDRPEGEALDAYLRQLGWYVAAAERLLGRPARGVLLAAG